MAQCLEWSRFFGLFLRLNDGQSGELDLGKTLEFVGVFAPLKDAREFAGVFPHRRTLARSG